MIFFFKHCITPTEFFCWGFGIDPKKQWFGQPFLEFLPNYTSKECLKNSIDPSIMYPYMCPFIPQKRFLGLENGLKSWIFKFGHFLAVFGGLFENLVLQDHILTPKFLQNEWKSTVYATYYLHKCFYHSQSMPLSLNGVDARPFGIFMDFPTLRSVQKWAVGDQKLMNHKDFEIETLLDVGDL